MARAKDSGGAIAPGNLLALGVAAILAGAGIGFVGGAFRWVLHELDRLRSDLSGWAQDIPGGILAPVLVCAAAAALAVALVRFSPRSAGSGIGQVEAVYRNQMMPPPLSVIPVRFAGGSLAIGAGLVLGREGPTIHMGSAIGLAVARTARMGRDDVAAMQIALSGAGLAVAFNAPVGGSLFVFEEVTKSFRWRMVVPTLLSVAVAVGCARLIIGDQPDFSVSAVSNPPLFLLPLFAVFGALLGVLGAGYNVVLMRLLAVADGLHRLPGTVRGGVIGAAVGAVVFVDPLAVGGGDALTQLLLAGHAFTVPALLAYLAIRFLAGPLSYAAGAPGGLFAPLLALGALAGVLFGEACRWVFPQLGEQFGTAMAIVGMSTMFAAVVRAPFTGIVLIIEMTAITTVTVPMLVAAGAAVLAAMAVNSAPVYDSLRERTLRINPGWKTEPFPPSPGT